jgi:hypothetical protein
MADSLEDTKRRLVTRYLGQAGIHGFGLRRSEDGICVYLERQSDPGQKELLDRIEREAAPFRLITVYEDRPLLS